MWSQEVSRSREGMVPSLGRDCGSLEMMRRRVSQGQWTTGRASSICGHMRDHTGAAFAYCTFFCATSERQRTGRVLTGSISGGTGRH